MSRRLGSLLLCGLLASCAEPRARAADELPLPAARMHHGFPLPPPEPAVAPSARPKRAPAPAPEPVALAEQTLTAEAAATRAGARVVGLLLELRDGVRETRYQHVTEVRRADGFYGWDCSGMTSWILRRTALRAFQALRRARASAADFYRIIDAAPTGRQRRGWQRLGHVSEARPGDLFAFLKSPLSQSKVTGHVGFLVEKPWPVPDMPGLYAARIADATSYPHQHDTRDADLAETGFGFGTMVFVTDEEGEAIAYGWYGTQSWGYMPTRIIFGRVWP